MKFSLPQALEAAMAAEADAAFPRECCGLIEGVALAEGFAATALHPARNLAGALDRFEIDPADHIAAVKQARGRGHRIIGCYHSHPGGEARPSPRDVAAAQEEDFLWLILAQDGRRRDLAAFVYAKSGFTPVTMVGADLVTSSSNRRG